MQRIGVPLISVALALVSTLGLYLSTDTAFLYWPFYVLLLASVLAFQLSVLTWLFDFLSTQPILAVFLLLTALGASVVAGLLLRTTFNDALLYWSVSTVFPVVCGALYIIDLVQKS